MLNVFNKGLGVFFFVGIALVRERIFDGYADHFRRASEYCKIACETKIKEVDDSTAQMLTTKT